MILNIIQIPVAGTIILFDDEIKNIIQDFKINDGSTYTDASSLTEGMMD